MKNTIFTIAAILLFASAAFGQWVTATPKVVKGVTILDDAVRNGNYIEYWTPPGQPGAILPDYAPVAVCAEYAKPGSRFMNGECSVNYYQHIPLNSPASYNCDKVFGAGKCTATSFYKDEPVRYIPSCPAGFQYLGGYRIKPSNDGGYQENSPIYLDSAGSIISSEDAAYYNTRGQILCGRLKPKYIMVSSHDGSYVVKPDGNSQPPTGDWVPTKATLKVEGDKLSGTFVSPAGTSSIDNGKIVGNKDITFTVTVDDVVYSYEGSLGGEMYFGGNVFATWTVDGRLQSAFFTIWRPDGWVPYTKVPPRP
jgi:hypothetical protein